MKTALDPGGVFDNTERGRQVRDTLKDCNHWIEALDRAEAPLKWREGSSRFDFDYKDQFDETTRADIANRIENNLFPEGFSFLYRYSDAVTFAVNFDRRGHFNNIQDREGMVDLLEAPGR